MSAIGSTGSYSVPTAPVTQGKKSAPVAPPSTPATGGNDPDHDGDSDGGHIDTKA